jgi:hypothetical protein
MRFIFLKLIILLILIPFSVVSQNYSNTNIPQTETKNLTQPSFPGGYDSLILYLVNNIQLTDTNITPNNIVYDAVLTFTVTNTGKITAFKSKGYNHEQVLPSIAKCFSHMPLWIPAKKNGKNISSTVQLTIAYMVNSSGVKIVKNDPLYVYNYERVEKKADKYFIVVTVLVLSLYFLYQYKR